MLKYFITAFLYFVSLSCFALGMQPETTVLVINQESGEASISVRNTNKVPTLLQVKIVDLEQGEDAIVLAAPAISKVDSDEEQVVRFFLQTRGELKSQVLKRINFIGLPARSENDKEKSTMLVGVNQSIPLIINPVGLKKEDTPWKYLAYKFNESGVSLYNPSRYVVRFHPKIKINGEYVKLQQSYLAPNQELKVDYKKSPSEVKIRPVGLYGEIRNEYKIEKANN
ncbi:fimbria/pilus periplasmic chaperone [Escherichia coli]|nr:hypothetical protein [Escherichia coli]ELL3512487.1 fimbria/pilus periplasmic chaperone [Escherichia coli]HAY4339756.1 fimbria/pilus periplasmic chaperone [Escherichia coli]HBN6547323.1 fimbria/pilus periplasmic chaperone [Escherichia coli]HBQ4484661.1 fimbria/pilus periplasmic chaperone [Escherichia coli]